MELSVISIGLTIFLGLIQIIKFFEDRHAKKESKLNVLAKKEDVDIRLNLMDSNIKFLFKEVDGSIDSHEKRLQTLEREGDVLEERVDNEVKNLGKIEDKIDSILERL